MNKRARLFVVIAVLIACGLFLYPTFHWYFVVPEAQKELSAGTREQIRNYARGRATRELEELKQIVLAEPDKEMPGGYDFLVSEARDNYRALDRDIPSPWAVSDVLGAFRNEGEVFSTLESHYRSKLMALKERRGNILELGLDLSGGMSVLLEANLENLAERLGRSPSSDEQELAISQAMEILNNRIDRFGVTEPQIRRQGDDRINIDIPGAADPDRVRSFLMGRGSLNFHIVDQEVSQQVAEFFARSPGEVYTPDGQVRRPDFLDAGLIIRGYYTKDEYGIDEWQRWVVVKEEVGLDGTHIEEATVGTHPITNRPVINFTLNRQGGDIFFQLTSANEGETMAILMEDRVRSMARISEPIRERVQMTGFDREEAQDLAIVLRTAAMPVDLNIISQQAVGASLGEDAVRQGLQAITLGFVLVMVFMLVYYLGAGVVANVALVLNLVIIISILSAFNLTLTLTSIAGLILTVGMSVDANVIIFERIKEEYRLGKTPDSAVKAGYRKAFWTIMDANVTTFIAALVLSQLGTGPIQGFANTLAVGIVSSMFTALFVTRIFFDFAVEQLKAKKLSLGWRI